MVRDFFRRDLLPDAAPKSEYQSTWVDLFSGYSSSVKVYRDNIGEVKKYAPLSLQPVAKGFQHMFWSSPATLWEKSLLSPICSEVRRG